MVRQSGHCDQVFTGHRRQVARAIRVAKREHRYIRVQHNYNNHSEKGANLVFRDVTEKTATGSVPMRKTVVPVRVAKLMLTCCNTGACKGLCKNCAGNRSNAGLLPGT